MWTGWREAWTRSGPKSGVDSESGSASRRKGSSLCYSAPGTPTSQHPPFAGSRLRAHKPRPLQPLSFLSHPYDVPVPAPFNPFMCQLCPAPNRKNPRDGACDRELIPSRRAYSARGPKALTSASAPLRASPASSVVSSARQGNYAVHRSTRPLASIPIVRPLVGAPRQTTSGTQDRFNPRAGNWSVQPVSKVRRKTMRQRFNPIVGRLVGATTHSRVSRCESIA